GVQSYQISVHQFLLVWCYRDDNRLPAIHHTPQQRSQTSESLMEAVLLGSGNVATHLGRALVGAGHRIKQVYSPTLAHARALAETLGAETIADLNAIDANADLYIIAVKDDAIETVAVQLPAALRGMVVHTAGSVAMTVLAAH